MARLNNVCEQGAKAAKRRQAVSGYWQTHATLQRWCSIRSDLDSALAHGLTALNAITRALEGNPWLPQVAAATELVSRERGTLTSGQGRRTMVHGIDCECGGSAARS